MAEQADVSIDLHGQFGYQKVHVHTSKVLGTGSYGSVVRATLDHLPCAAKILHTIFFRSDDPGAADFAARFDQECCILRDLKHPCIVQFLGLVQDPGNRRPILLMELMEESLTGFLERSPAPLPYHVQVSITHDIVLALAYLHANKIIHRDLSSNNILLNAGSQAKVTDFGMSKMVEANPRMTRSKITQCPGTPVFMPPEALRAKPCYSDKLDTFSVGVLIIQIITRTFPAPTDAEIVMEDPSAPTGEKIILIPELERREKDIDKVPTDHSLLPIAHHCLKDRDKERSTAAQLCQSLEQLKAAQAYEDSKAAENQQSRASLLQQLRLKEEESARLQEQMRKEQESKEKEIVELRRQLQSAQISAQARPQRITAAVRRASKPEDEKALCVAAMSGDVSAVRQLVAANVNVDCTPFRDGMTPLMVASLSGHVEVVRALIGSQAQVNTQDEDGHTALHMAADEGKVDVVRLLTEAGAQPNIRAKGGWTALHQAAQEGKVDVVRLLTEAGAQLNIKTKDGMTPLMSASLKGHVEVVKTLIGSQAQLNTQDKNGWTALHIAAQEGKVDVVRLLIEAGAQLNIKTEDGKTPLMLASWTGHVEIVRTLIGSQAQLNTQGKDDATALHIAAQEGKVDVVRLLIEAGAQLNIQTMKMGTPIYVASDNGRTDVVDALIRAGASVNQACMDSHSITLGIAAEKGRLDTVKRLVEGGAKINHQNRLGATSLHVACLKGRTDVVGYLIRAGANINLAATNGMRPIEVARAKGHSDIVRLLKRRNK